MRTLPAVLLAAMSAVLVAGCAVAPAYGPYDNAYGHPYYYGDGGPFYYGYGPGYYYDYGSPGIFGTFRFGHRDRDWRWNRRWRDSSGSWHREGPWQHNTLHPGNDRTTTQMSRSNHRAGAGRSTSRSSSERRAESSPRAHGGPSRENRSDRS